MKKHLVTGTAGFIASHYVEELLKSKNIKIFCLDKVKSKYLKSLKNSKLKFISCDITNYKKLQRIINKIKPHYIINFAAETHVDRSIENAKNFVDTNIKGVFNFLEILKEKRNIRFLQVSTDEVFGSLKLKDKKKFKLSSKYSPNNPYSASKASGDLLVKSYFKTFGLDLIICNSSNNFGERQHPEKLIPLVINQAFSKKKIPIYGNGKNIRDWMYVKNNCKLIKKIMLNGKSGSQYLIGSNNEISNIVLVKKILKIISKKTKVKYEEYERLIEFIEDRKGHDLRYSIDNSSIKKFLNKIKFNFEKEINVTIDFNLSKYKEIRKKINNEKWFNIKYKNLNTR